MVSSHTATAIILCGGMGTRLHAITKDQTAKPMVEVAGRPFLQYLLDYLIQQGISQVVLAVGHHKHIIMDYFGERYESLTIRYSIETNPLGTGGALKQAMQNPAVQQSELALVLNGDSFIGFDLQDMIKQLTQHNADLVMALREMDNTGRYGRVTVDRNSKLTAFEEKKGGQPGTINSGVYLMRTSLRERFPVQPSFSFETDFLEVQIRKAAFYGYLSGSYFIDIGTPSDYKQAQTEFVNKINTQQTCPTLT
ncbi:nucleotidyltransferase family protein [Vibrio tritonius]|uniref:Nucleotidyltransferase family protein n=1 Tax=Vibrio tritonius TaxID=1435069 RepID=A0ABS7YQQ9_9VIBR|nr:nucleotidyltransferase family protein [Vibrio tritonius]MCA2018015.1 nucleotidyltransferase family protein [Vibrio tritonius]